MAMAGMAGTAIAVALAVLREKADRRSLKREIEEEEVEARAQEESVREEDKQVEPEPPSDEKETTDG